MKITDTFAPVPKPAIARLLFSYTASQKLHAHHVDLETAFLIPDIVKTIYAKKPAAYVDPKCPESDDVLLNKALSGLKQSACLWHNNVKNKLTSLGVRQSDADEADFVRQDGDNNVTIVAVYVDGPNCPKHTQSRTSVVSNAFLDWIYAVPTLPSPCSFLNPRMPAKCSIGLACRIAIPPNLLSQTHLNVTNDMIANNPPTKSYIAKFLALSDIYLRTPILTLVSLFQNYPNISPILLFNTCMQQSTSFVI